MNLSGLAIIVDEPTQFSIFLAFQKMLVALWICVRYEFYSHLYELAANGLNFIWSLFDLLKYCETFPIQHLSVAFLLILMIVMVLFS